MFSAAASPAPSALFHSLFSPSPHRFSLFTATRHPPSLISVHLGFFFLCFVAFAEFLVFLRLLFSPLALRMRSHQLLGLLCASRSSLLPSPPRRLRDRV